MSELLNQLPIQEILRPDVTPEMGFQSYEMLGDDTGPRTAEQAAFLLGESVRPKLEYPLIEEALLDKGIQNLTAIGNLSESIADSDYSSAVWSSAGYRLAEMYWLKQVKRLDDARDNPKSGLFNRRADAYQDYNEQLYGKPDKQITANIIGEVFLQAESKQLDQAGLRILDELQNGTTSQIADEMIKMRSLADKSDGRLPEIGNKLNILREVVQDEFPAAYEIVDSYWNEVVAPRHREDNTVLAFNVHDMKTMFTQLRDSIDPDNDANISIVMNKTGSQLAWDTPSMSVRIGSQRAKIDDKLEMVGHIIHEFGVHGGRAVHGLKTDMPVLGTGLFTEALEGEQSDYLTFEEGFASLINIAVSGKTPIWKPVNISHYLNLGLAYDGADFRESFEILWRARVLMAAPDGKPLTEDLIEKERKQAYISMIRTHRGTPTEVMHDGPLMFNKDLAYLGGKLIALGYLDQVGDDKAAIRQAIRGKFDPTNTVQKRIADKYIPAV